MQEEPLIREGQVLQGPLFNEPMRVIKAQADTAGTWTIDAAGVNTEKFRHITLNPDQIAILSISEAAFDYHGDGKLLRLGLQAWALGIAWEFDPYFGLSMSRVDPLPHQLEAVYEHLLKAARVRFLLADDAGAGKTIMAGLLIRELELRGLAERIMIVCPANLAFQWQRELREKFDASFEVMKGSDIREQFGFNQWREKKRVITSLDLAKREDILPGLRQVHWELVIVDEAHRMSASDESHKSQRYRLGELLRDSSDHLLLLTATPHRGDPKNFSLFLQLLDRDAFADVKSIQEAMGKRAAPFYLRRTKEAMIHFPKQQPDGTWAARRIFTRRITRTVNFVIDGPEDDLYRGVTRFVREQSAKAAALGDTPRARAVGFLMMLYQRRLASSAYALQCSLEKRARRLEEGLKKALTGESPASLDLPNPEDREEMEEAEREALEHRLEAVSLWASEPQIREEIRWLRELAAQAREVEDRGEEAKLATLKDLLQKEGFYDDPEQRLLVFTEFKDTLRYLLKKFTEWGFKAGCIHGGMKPGSRDEPGTRLYAEQQFREGQIQILVATEAAGEGINLQVCHILFNYDIPWNPNRLEQRMGRIHRYGQQKDCLIFNFTAANTVEGQVLQTLLRKIQEIRDALDDDGVFNVVGEVLPAARIESTLRDYYAGKLGAADLEERILEQVDKKRFEDICRNALEGLASKKLNLAMLLERQALAQERRLVPETIARFLLESAPYAHLELREVPGVPHTFDPGKTPSSLRHFEGEEGWRFPALAARYPRCSTDRKTAEEHSFEWITPGHPLFEGIRRQILSLAGDVLRSGACFYSLDHEGPARLDVYRVRVVDGLGTTLREGLFGVEMAEDREPVLRDWGVLVNYSRGTAPDPLPAVAALPEAIEWLQAHAFGPLLEEVRQDRLPEIERVQTHVELSLNELLGRADQDIGYIGIERDEGVSGAEGRLAMAEARHDELQARLKRRRQELDRQKSLSLQGMERISSVLLLPHPEREAGDVRPLLRQNPRTEAIAMQVVMEYETRRGCIVTDVHLKNLGYDIKSFHPRSGAQRLIEIKGLGDVVGRIHLTPNERRVAEDRQDLYWLYVVTNCDSRPILQEPVPNPARFPWHEVQKVQHYWLEVNAMTEPMEVHEPFPEYGQEAPQR